MKRVLIFLVVCGAFIAQPKGVQAQKITIEGSGNYVTREIRTGGNIDALVVDSNINIEYRQSTDGTMKVELYGSDNVIEYMDARVSGNTVTATMKGRSIYVKGDKAVKKVIVTSPTLRSATVKSSGNIRILGEISGGNITFSTSSSGSINAESIDCDKCILSTSSSGGIKIGRLDASEVEATTRSSGSISIESGSANAAKYDVRSLGNILAEGLITEKVKAVTRSSGKITCYATVAVNARSTSSGSITYDGNPRTRTLVGNTKYIKKR